MVLGSSNGAPVGGVAASD
ncbi:MAG: hypothetical protein HYW50_00650, partial [Candidatus Diapherotrites archaeon]|nr:hypothetical protein [Candidatus Diapherotrites archaeon]